jgi:hypothetical protein
MTAILEPQSAQVDETVERVPVAAAPAPVAEAAPARPPAQAAPVRPPAPPRVRQVLSSRGVRFFGAAMIALYTLGVAVQPAPDGPQPVAPWWADALNTVAFFGLLTVFAGAIAGRRWALWTGLVTGASLFTLSASCPVEGHHEIAAWWFVQMAVGVAMTVLPATLLRRTQAGSRAA